MKKILNILLLAVTVFTVSCISDHSWNDPGNNTGGETEIMLHLQTPGGFSEPTMRNLTFAQENHLEDVYVLVFDHTANTLTDIRKARVLNQNTVHPETGNSGRATFAVSLNSSDDNVRLVVLTNVRDILEDIADNKNSDVITIDIFTAKDYKTVTEQITGKINGKMFQNTGEYIPMWAETEPFKIQEGSNPTRQLQLMRAIARIDVGVGHPLHKAGSPSATSDEWEWNGNENKYGTGKPIPFELTGVYIIKPGKAFAVVPGQGNITGSKATAPTLTGAGNFDLKESIDEFFFDDKAISGVTDNKGGWTTRSIYIPEADVKVTNDGKSGDANHTNRMAVIVKGKWNGQTESFYRADFTEDGTNIINVLRNHLYRFNIIGVSGNGYRTPEEAYNNRAMNMEVNVIKWNEEELNNVHFDRTNFFSYTRNKVTFTPFGGVDSVRFRTNVEDFYLELENGTKLEAPKITTDVAIRHTEHFTYRLSRDGADSEYYTLHIVAQQNVSDTPSDKPARDNWTIHASRIDIEFTVEQQWTNLYISVEDGASTRLYPEGTRTRGISEDHIHIPVNVLTSSQVKVSVNYRSGSGSDWLQGIAHGEVITQKGEFKLEVDIFQHTAGAGNRIVDITFTPEPPHRPVTYTIVQEAPYIEIDPTERREPRPTQEETEPRTTTFMVHTNIRQGDLTVAPTDAPSNSDRIWINGPMTYPDGTRPRIGQFTVSVDLTGEVKELPGGRISTEFEAKANPAYGVLVNTAEVWVPQRFAPPTGGTFATPGQLGVTADGKLTLKGSSTFANVTFIRNNAEEHFDGLEEVPVYAVHFKLGSAIAINAEGNPFDAEQHIVWAPAEFDLSTITNYASVPVNTINTEAHLLGNEGLGDPCRAAVGKAGKRYVSPTRLAAGGSGWRSHRPPMAINAQLVGEPARVIKASSDGGGHSLADVGYRDPWGHAMSRAQNVQNTFIIMYDWIPLPQIIAGPAQTGASSITQRHGITNWDPSQWGWIGSHTAYTERCIEE
jgi:hypothetical protein